MRADRHDHTPLPVLGLGVLACFAVTLAFQIAAKTWSTVTYARFGSSWAGTDYTGAGWREVTRIRRAGGHHLGTVDPGQAAGRAGLAQGNLIVEVNGRRVVEHPEAWLGFPFWMHGGDTLRIAYTRGIDPQAAAVQAAAIERLDPFQGARAWAGVWNARGDSARAIAAFRRAVELDTSRAQDEAVRFLFHLQNVGRHEEAADVCRAILARDSANASALYQLGRSDLMARRNLGEAERCFRRYLTEPPKPSHPTRGQAHWRLGMVLDLQGRHAEAIAELRKARDLEPFDQNVARTLREVAEKQARGDK